MLDAVVLTHGMDGKLRPGDVDWAIAWLAELQHGVVAQWQLRALRIGRGAIEHRLRCGRLHRVHRGIYTVGSPVLSADGRRMAAVLAGGAHSVLSHRSAAELHGLRSSASARFDVVVPKKRNQSRGIRWRSADLPADEVTRVRGIPLTCVARTIFDIAADGSRNEVERLVKEADVLRLGGRVSLAQLLARYPRRPGAPIVRAVLEQRRLGAGVPQNALEDAFLEFLDRHELPRPEVNAWLTLGKHTYRPDCLWRTQKVIVELDGRDAHGTPEAFESDRERDRVLSVHKWRPIRVTWRQLHEDDGALAADLRELL